MVTLGVFARFLARRAAAAPVYAGLATPASSHAAPLSVPTFPASRASSIASLFFSFVCALFALCAKIAFFRPFVFMGLRTLLQRAFSQVQRVQSFPHSLRKYRGVGGDEVAQAPAGFSSLCRQTYPHRRNLFRITSFADPLPLTPDESHLCGKHRGPGSSLDYPAPSRRADGGLSELPLHRYFIPSLLLFCLAGCAAKPAPLAITHATVIDATGSPPQPDTTVLISHQHILAVGPSSRIAIPSGFRVLDAADKFLIPGLADMHVHLTAAGEPTGSRQFMLPVLLANGITTVRNMGGKVEYLTQLRSEITSGARLGPQVFLTGPYLDGDPPGYQPSIVVKSAEEARTAVDQLAAEHVEFIKTQSVLSREAFFAIAEESKKQSICFVGHVPDRVSALEASNAGQASIEHLTGILLACSSKEDELRHQQFLSNPPNETTEQSLRRSRAWQRALLDSYSPEKAAALFRAFVANGTWQVPTFPIVAHLGFMTPATDLSRDPRMKFVPQNERKIWQQGVTVRLEHRSEADFAFRAEIVSRYLDLVGRMQSSRVRFLAGTDTPAPNVFPGSSLQEDLAYLVQAGLTPLQALQAATKNPADFLGKLASQGTIEQGKFADLVLLDANPLDDIHNTQKIRAVILRGQLLDRPALDALLSSVEQFAQTN